MNKHQKSTSWLRDATKIPGRVLLVFGISACLGLAANANDVKKFELTWGLHVTDGMAEQDVFVEKTTNSKEVRRLPVSQIADYLDKQIFGAAVAPPYQPMILEPTEVYPKGSALGITLRDWLQAKGSGSYACDGKQATIKASFQNLVPNGVYTVWNFIDLYPPVEPWQGLLVPAGKRDGSQASFKADASGNATYNLVVEPCLQLSSTQSLAGLAIAWHSDGKTYGFYPGDLGVVSHAQLMTLFPGGPGSH